MNAFEALRSQLESTQPESGILFLSQKDAREILTTYDELVGCELGILEIPQTVPMPAPVDWPPRPA